jgi:hypothetical protein
MLQAKPDMYKDVLTFSGKSTGEPTIGGLLRRPNLPLSYMLAARHVIDRAEADERLAEIALPAAYLQRHALELLLKDALSAAYEIERDRRWLTNLRKNRRAKRPPETHVVPSWHSHGELRKLLCAALKEINFGPLPWVVTSMCARIARAEARAPERYRYQMVEFNKKRRKGKKHRKKKLKEAFGKRETLEIIATQNLLEATFQKVFHFDKAIMSIDGSKKKPNLGTSLSYECHALSSTIVQNYPSTW